MKQEHFILEELRKIAPAYFRQLIYCPGKGDYTVEIRQRRYQNLPDRISDLLKLCIMVTDEELEMSSDISRLNFSINSILGMIYPLFPMHESKFIDILRDYFHKD
ncbi:hypothetical protein [Sinomicrobium sp. M5D2P9]